MSALANHFEKRAQVFSALVSVWLVTVIGLIDYLAGYTITNQGPPRGDHRRRLGHCTQSDERDVYEMHQVRAGQPDNSK